MAQTYLQIQQQIASLQRESEAMRHAEVKTAIEKAKAIIVRFSLTAEQLGLSSASSAVTAPASLVVAKQAVAKKAVAKKAAVKPTPAPVLPAPPAVPMPAQKAMAPATKKVAAPAAKTVAAPVAKKATGAAAKQPLAIAANTTVAPAAATPAAVSASPAPAAKKAAPKYVAAIRYRDGDANSWSGFGPKPKWLVAGIAAGSTLESFAVGK